MMPARGMMRTKGLIFCIFAACLLATSCRDMGDDLLSYGQNDAQAFDPTDKSYAAQFEAFWTAMNENYCIWDYEEQFGLNWDEVYNTYLPTFQAFDNEQQQKPTDEEFKALYAQILDSLHDGHSMFQLRNLSTGHYISIYPCLDRNLRERPERYLAEQKHITNIDAYLTTDVDIAYQALDYQLASSNTIVMTILDSTANRILRASTAYLAAVEAAGGTNALNDTIVDAVIRLQKNALLILNYLNLPRYQLLNALPQLGTMYNRMRDKYGIIAAQIGVQMPAIDNQILNDRVKYIHYALFPGNIAYIRLGGFGLSLHMHPDKISSDTTSAYYAYQMAVTRVWRAWFDAIQYHHQQGDLGGVIIDVRNNGGGYVIDYQYMVGALLPSGGVNLLTVRVKNGSGRLDFAPLIPFIAGTYPDEHAVITEQPIVVLANSNSVSMAENTTWGVISRPNGYFIGTRTYGGLSALGATPEDYSAHYSGAFGVENVTSFYGYVPKFVFLYGSELQPRESIGFVPNEDLPLDTLLWTTLSRDNQLERAIDYIQHK